jgi:hypothetical protein
MSSSRLSLGGSALRDSSSRMNARSRRQSLGGALAAAKETPQKDRREMLDDWRRQVKIDDKNNTNPHKRDRDDNTAHETMSTAAVISTEGTTALERYRMRKQQKLLQQHAEENYGSRPPLLPPSRSFVPSTYDDDETTGDYSRTAVAAASVSVLTGTPSFSRRLTSSGRAARRKSFSVGPNHRTRETLSQESREPECKFPHERAQSSQHLPQALISHKHPALPQLPN